MIKKKALVLGATGQDGSYMIDLLLKKNYQVHGLYRKSSVGNTNNLDHLINDNKVFNKKSRGVAIKRFVKLGNQSK